MHASVPSRSTYAKFVRKTNWSDLIPALAHRQNSWAELPSALHYTSTFLAKAQLSVTLPLRSCAVEKLAHAHRCVLLCARCSWRSRGHQLSSSNDSVHLQDRLVVWAVGFVEYIKRGARYAQALLVVSCAWAHALHVWRECARAAACVCVRCACACVRACAPLASMANAAQYASTCIHQVVCNLKRDHKLLKTRASSASAKGAGRHVCACARVVCVRGGGWAQCTP